MRLLKPPHSTVHFKMVQMVNFVMWIFILIKNLKKYIYRKALAQKSIVLHTFLIYIILMEMFHGLLFGNQSEKTMIPTIICVKLIF